MRILRPKLESAIQREITKQLRGKNILVFKMQLLGITGVPDLLVVGRGGYVRWLEVKRPGKELTPKQKWFHAKLKELGHHVYIVTSKEEAEKHCQIAG